MRALQVKCRFLSVEEPADMLAVVKLADGSLDLDRQMTKREQVLVEEKRKLHIARSAAFFGSA